MPEQVSTTSLDQHGPGDANGDAAADDTAATQPASEIPAAGQGLPWFSDVGLVYGSDNAPIDVALRRANEGDLSAEAAQLLATINLASIRVQIAFRDFPAERRRLFEGLKAIANNGLVGQHPHPKTALIDFENFKISVAAAADIIRGRFLSQTIVVNLIAIAIALFLLAIWLPMHGLVFTNVATALATCSGTAGAPSVCADAPIRLALELAGWTTFDNAPGAEVVKTFRIASNLAGAALLAFVGIALGLLLIGFLRNRLISYDNFDSIFRYRMAPSLYLLFISCLGLTVLAIVGFNIVVLGVGNLNLNDVLENPAIGIMIGLLCSISEPFVSALVVRQLRPSEKGGD